MMFRTLIFGLAIVANLALPARAAVNICWELIEPVWVPPQPLDALQCTERNFLLCGVGFPQCCLPECNILPECIIGGELIGGHWDTLECEFLEPEEALVKLLRESLRPLTDFVEPLKNVLTQHIEILGLTGQGLPENAKEIIKTLVPGRDVDGVRGFSHGHVDRMVLVSSANETAGIYLPEFDGLDRAAITLDQIVIVNDRDYDRIVENPDVTLLDIRCGRAPAGYVNALALAVHELVHVRQWDEIGRDAFLSTYLPEVIVSGHAGSQFEIEAFAFEAVFRDLLAPRINPGSLACNPETGRTRTLPAAMNIIHGG